MTKKEEKKQYQNTIKAGQWAHQQNFIFIKLFIYYVFSVYSKPKHTYRIPFVQIWQVDFPIVIHKHRHFDLHIRCWLYECQRRIVWMCVHQPNTNWNMIGVVCERKNHLATFGCDSFRRTQFTSALVLTFVDNWNSSTKI